MNINTIFMYTAALSMLLAVEAIQLPTGEKSAAFLKKGNDTRQATLKASENVAVNMSAGAQPITPYIAAMAATCVYRDSINNHLNLLASISETCTKLWRSGWKLEDTFEHADPVMTGDTDAADLYRSGDSCLLAFRGADIEFFTTLGGGASPEAKAEFCAPIDTFHAPVGFAKGLTLELQAILDQITAKHGSLATFASTMCKGELHVTGHSMGGGVATILAYLANLDSDPLAMRKPVSKVYLFSSMPVAATDQLINEHGKAATGNGCFEGASYYTRWPTGLGAATGYDELGDVAMLTCFFAGNAGIKPPKTIAWTSLDLTGPFDVPANSKGPTLQTACGELPPVYDKMKNDPSLYALSGSHGVRGVKPNDKGIISLHDPVAAVYTLKPGQCSEWTGQCPRNIPFRYPNSNRCFQHQWGGNSCNVDPETDPNANNRGDANVCQCVPSTKQFQACGSTCPKEAPNLYPGTKRCFETASWGGNSCNLDPENDILLHKHDAKCDCSSS